MTIKETTYLNAAVSALELSASGVHLSANVSSPLGELLDLSVSCNQVKTTDAPAILMSPGFRQSAEPMSAEERARHVSYVTTGYQEESLHSLKMAAMAADIAPFIVAHIAHARNVVAPMVMELGGKLDKFLQSARPLDPSSTFEIDQRQIPSLVLDEAFLADGVENYDGIEVSWKGFPYELEVPETADFYRGLTRLGSDRLNSLVDEWLATKEPEFIKRLYIANFSNSLIDLSSVFQRGDYFLNGEPGRSINPYDQLDIALGCFLISQRLFRDIQPTKGVSLIEYKSAMRSVIDYAGSMLLRSIRTARRQLDGGVMVSEIVLSKKRVVVNKTLYRAWLESGGKPEALLGMVASGQVYYTVASIEEAKEKLIRQWQTYVMLSSADVKSEMDKRFTNYVMAEMAASLAELGQTEVDYAANYHDFKKRVMDNVAAELEHLGRRAMEDVFHTALHLVAKARFFYTSSYSILSEMNEVAKHNPDIDVREAALLSAINYFCEYVETQVKVVG